MASPKLVNLGKDWSILQDVHDVGETLGLPGGSPSNTDPGSQLSEWELLPELGHLQVALADNPYWGKELRYFNAAPWWYKKEFEAEKIPGDSALLRFSNVDYACRVWLNGVFLGDHEGYSAPFEFDVTEALTSGANVLVVKVWSPWDSRIRDDMAARRTFMVEREMVKGTYEHDDTLIARDVNPIGIYGDVRLLLGQALLDKDGLQIEYQFDGADVEATVRGHVVGRFPSQKLPLTVRDESSGQSVASAELALSEEGVLAGQVRIESVHRWETWDRGTPWLYGFELDLPGGETIAVRTGFRTVEMERTEDHTLLKINGIDLFVRGTSYFPDVYISRMHRDRYLRDLQAMRDAGFNLIRVHVHVQNAEFYQLCDELGFAVMQDSEYNWTHPESEEFADKITGIYLETVKQLRNHPSLVTWICLNEPGAQDPAGASMTGGTAMTVAPGPALLDAVSAADPSRPLILGSYCENDPNSGDSHNYRGSLYGPDEDYIAIDGTTEKLNTEFGVDAPGCLENLMAYPDVAKRIQTSADLVERSQYYQYRLVKYYTEHYRQQRFDPCSGYVQFMFIDLSPQSWYGVLDFWGMPKLVWNALLESNQPVAVVLAQNATSAKDILIINDTLEPLGAVTARWSATSPDGLEWSGEVSVNVPASATVRVETSKLSLDAHGDHVAVRLDLVDALGRRIINNRYEDLFAHPAHIAGHPNRMSHEMGMRLFDMA